MVSSKIGRHNIVLCLVVYMYLFDVRFVDVLGLALIGPQGPPGPPGPRDPYGPRPPGSPSGPGYASPTGLTCSRYGCEVGGVCRTVASTGQLACLCPPYATGNRCEKDVDECRLLIACLNNGTCVNAYRRPYTCECLPEYEGPFCERVNGTITDPCDPNPCGNGATCSRSDSNTFLPMCTCTPGWHGPTCEIYFTPVISEVFPLVGPIAGGTDLLLSGSDLYGVGRPEIHLGVMSCNTWTRNSTSLQCVTPPVSSYLVGVPLPISVRWRLVGFTLNLSETFTYKKDPVIQGIEPMESIVSGGVTLTVTGLGLDAIAKPVLKISMWLENVFIHTFRSPCTVTEPTTMLCQTPPFDIINSEGELDLSNYTRRTLSAQNSSIPGGRLDSSDLQFLIDFELDGVGRGSSPGPIPPTVGQPGPPGPGGPEGSGPSFYFKLKVYADPIIRGWTEPVIIDNAHRILEIKGKRLLKGLRPSDYVVWIGQSPCTGLGVADNLLYCKAPEQIPQPHPEHDDGRRGRLAVRVHLGRNKQPYMIGHVIYRIHFFDDPVKKWAVIGSAIALVVLPVFVAMICSTKKKKVPTATLR